MSPIGLLLIVLVVLLVAGGGWGYRAGWHNAGPYYGSGLGVVGIIILVLLVLLIMGRL